ncbi:MAG TPA: GNAT family N-acetyltransferase [Steroidobacteraceae bacterium]|nr:GNAT family N-acetyltransferase [Steroidobacteraceae bacterium]
MRAHPMDNPVWHSLATQQSAFAIGDEYALRYSPSIAPFVAIPEDSESSRLAAATLVTSGESVYFVGVAPRDLSGWEVLSDSYILQMMWDFATELPSDRSDIVELSAADAPAMVELTALAFPGFFRERTVELGRYCGIRHGDQLISMAGERMRATMFQEISGVCTHPNYVGRGYSARLNACMIESICKREVQPFLHVSSNNARAQSLYRRLGFETRAELRLWHVRRL